MSDILEKARLLRLANQTLEAAIDTASKARVDAQRAVNSVTEARKGVSEAQSALLVAASSDQGGGRAETSAIQAIDSLNKEAEEAGHDTGRFLGEPDAPQRVSDGDSSGSENGVVSDQSDAPETRDDADGHSSVGETSEAPADEAVAVIERAEERIAADEKYPF